MKKKISELSIRRLNLYYRYIRDLLKQKKAKVLSGDIARYFNLDPSQVRKDFSFVGQLGKRGSGYKISTLQEDIRQNMLINKRLDAVIVGCGKLGTALLGYPMLKEFNFNVKMGFDVQKEVINKEIHKVKVADYRNIESYIRKHRIRVAILTVPEDRAKNVAEDLIRFGIRGILNFSPVFMHFGDRVLIKNVDFSVDFNIFRYQFFQERIK